MPLRMEWVSLHKKECYLLQSFHSYFGVNYTHRFLQCMHIVPTSLASDCGWGWLGRRRKTCPGDQPSRIWKPPSLSPPVLSWILLWAVTEHPCMQFIADSGRWRGHPSCSADCRFHWRGHVGCSSGYSLDRYDTPQISSINSQVNEHANAGLQLIKGQITYMKPDNFNFF